MCFIASISGLPACFPDQDHLPIVRESSGQYGLINLDFVPVAIGSVAWKASQMRRDVVST